MQMLAQEEAAHEATRKELTSTFLRVKESLTEKIVKLSSQIQELHDAKDDMDFGSEVLQEKHVSALSRKDADISALKAKMDDSKYNNRLSVNLPQFFFLDHATFVLVTWVSFLLTLQLFFSPQWLKNSKKCCNLC